MRPWHHTASGIDESGTSVDTPRLLAARVLFERVGGDSVVAARRSPNQRWALG